MFMISDVYGHTMGSLQELKHISKDLTGVRKKDHVAC